MEILWAHRRSSSLGSSAFDSRVDGAHSSDSCSKFRRNNSYDPSGWNVSLVFCNCAEVAISEFRDSEGFSDTAVRASLKRESILQRLARTSRSPARRHAPPIRTTAFCCHWNKPGYVQKHAGEARASLQLTCTSDKRTHTVQECALMMAIRRWPIFKSLTETTAVPVQLTRDLQTVSLSRQETCCHLHIRDWEIVGIVHTL
jgi:hypothetical protein